jgi:hypothetical protein
MKKWVVSSASLDAENSRFAKNLWFLDVLLISNSYLKEESKARVMEREKFFNIVLNSIIFFVLILLVNISYISAGEKYTLKVTEEHLFYVVNDINEETNIINGNDDLNEVAGESESKVDDNNNINGIWKTAKELQIGDELITDDKKKARITSVKNINSDVEVYNLEAEKFNDFIVNGNVVVHNSNPIPGSYWMDPNKVYTDAQRLDNARGLIGNLVDQTCSFVDSEGMTRTMSIGEALLYAHSPKNFKTPMQKFLFLRKLVDANGNQIFGIGDGYCRIFSLLKNNVCGGINLEKTIADKIINELNLKPEKIPASESKKIGEATKAILELSTFAQDAGDISIIQNEQMGIVKVAGISETSKKTYTIATFEIAEPINNEKFIIKVIFEKTDKGYVIKTPLVEKIKPVSAPFQSQEFVPTLEAIEDAVFNLEYGDMYDLDKNPLLSKEKNQLRGVFLDVFDIDGKPVRRYFWNPTALFAKPAKDLKGYDAGWCIKHKAYEDGYGLKQATGLERVGFENPEEIVIEYLQKIIAANNLREMQCVRVEKKIKNPSNDKIETTYEIYWGISELPGPGGNVYFIHFYHAIMKKTNVKKASIE